MPLYALTIFVSAFLLFLVQPVMAKQILPWFGGSSTVWTTCLVFFQTTLLLGYAYADWVVHRLSPRWQFTLHVLLLLLSCAVLPIIPGAQWKPAGTESPSLLILGLLGASIGLPYLLLATTSPLLQAWFARSFPGRSPYWLFALSNLASMLALLGYPFGLEPWVATARRIAAEGADTFVILNNHFRGKAVVNALQIKAALEGGLVTVPEPLLAAYPALSTVAKPPEGRLPF